MWNSNVFFYMFPPFVRCIKDRSHYYKIVFKYTSVFNFFNHDIELCFVPYFSAESGKIYILKVHISFSCINTQYNQQHHSMTLPLYHLHTAKIEICGYIRGGTIVVREIVTLI